MPTGQADILAQPLRAATGITETRARAFAALGLRTVGELIRHFPFRVEQEAGEASISATTRPSWLNRLSRSSTRSAARMRP